MVSKTSVGWLLDVSKDKGDIILLIKIEDGTGISFKQRLHEPIFYILPKSKSAGEDLFQQLSRQQDQLIKRIFWDEKYIDLHDKIKTRLIGIRLDNTQSTTTRQDYMKLIQKLKDDSRVNALFNTDLSDLTQFIYTRLGIPPTSKIKVEYEDEQLLSIERIDDHNEMAAPLFSIMCIENLNEATSDNNSRPKIVVRTDDHSESLIFDGISDPAFTSCINQKDPDIVVCCGDGSFTEWSNHRVVIYSHNVRDVNLYELVEKARFSYLPLELAARCGMIRLIESRITYELIQRGFVIPARTNTISKHHEQIRTLEDIVEFDKAGMIISPAIGLHENVAVLDFNDEYANLILNHNISYETLAPTVTRNQTALLPSIIEELVSRRANFKRQLKEEIQPNSSLYHGYEVRLETLKQILVCLYGTSGSIWNRYSNVQVFEEINKLSREILLKTKDIVQSSGFDLIYADTDAVFLKKKDATKSDYEEIMNVLIKETGLDMSLEFHYKFLVLLYIEADEKMEARKHYYGLTYDNQLITRGIDTRRHDSPVFLKEFQSILLSKLFDCNSAEEVLTTGYENALQHVTHSIDKLMNGEIQVTDLVISKLLRQNIEKYRSLFPHVAAAMRLNISGATIDRGDNIQYVYTDSNHADPLQRIVPAKLISSSEEYDRVTYLDMIFDSAEAVLSVFGFNRSLYGFDRNPAYHWWDELYRQHERDIESARSEL